MDKKIELEYLRKRLIDIRKRDNDKLHSIKVKKMIEKAKEDGYQQGLEDRHNQHKETVIYYEGIIKDLKRQIEGEIKSVNNWDSDKVFPKDSIKN